MYKASEQREWKSCHYANSIHVPVCWSSLYCCHIKPSFEGCRQSKHTYETPNIPSESKTCTLASSTLYILGCPLRSTQLNLSVFMPLLYLLRYIVCSPRCGTTESLYSARTPRDSCYARPQHANRETHARPNLRGVFPACPKAASSYFPMCRRILSASMLGAISMSLMKRPKTMSLSCRELTSCRTASTAILDTNNAAASPLPLHITCDRAIFCALAFHFMGALG